MSIEPSSPNSSKAMVWAGRIISALPVLMLIFSGVLKVTQADMVVKGFAEQGFPASAPLWIGIVELLSTALYVIPQTTYLGAILLTGYLGGAIVTHVRLSEPFVFPLLFGVLVWLGLYLRDGRLRSLIPWNRRDGY